MRQIADARAEMLRADLCTESFKLSSLPVLLPATAALVSTISAEARQQADINLSAMEAFAWWFAIPLLDLSFSQMPAAAEALVTQTLAAALARMADDAAEHGAESTAAQRLETLVGDAAPTRRRDLHRLISLARQPEAEWVPGRADAWHRAAPLAFVPECLIPHTPRTWCSRFRDYLSLTILVDDAEDVIEDLRAGRATWPVRRMTELNWSPMRGGANQRLVSEIAGAVSHYRERIAAASSNDTGILTLVSELLRP